MGGLQFEVGVGMQITVLPLAYSCSKALRFFNNIIF
jgi:hypothetical protein